jgi:hypothetical protein
MRCKAVLVTLALSFIAPGFVATSNAAQSGTVRGSSGDTSCRHKRAKKAETESKPKKKDKEAKKSYGFEL